MSVVWTAHKVGVPRALGERPRGECERVCKALSEPSTERCAVCVPRGSHCGRPLASQWGLLGRVGPGGVGELAVQASGDCPPCCWSK